jgi:hypothetical protein
VPTVTQATLAAALLKAMIAIAPPAKIAALPAYPGFEEDAAARAARYESIADDAAAVALDPAVAPLPGRSRSATAAMIIALDFEESGFALDVDRGPTCYRGANGKNARCDGGRSACGLQLHIGAGTTAEGWTQADLFADRKKCFRAGLRLARRSFAACASMGVTHLLDSFASGVCGLGNAKGQKRLATAARVELLMGAP